MKEQNLKATNTQVGLFKKVVEAKIKASASLPTMAFETAKNYYRHLEQELVTVNPGMADTLSAQYKELSAIFGIKPKVAEILQKRYSASSLQCGFGNVKEYLALLMAQRKDMADATKCPELEEEIQRAEFCTYL